MAFDEIRLPDDVERGAQGGPEFKTTILPLSSGFEKRNQDWSTQRGMWDVSYGIQSKDDLKDLIKFFYARRGRARGFRFKDWSDFEMVNQAIGIGDSTTGSDGNADFQIYKRYTSGSIDYDRVITKPVDLTVVVKVNSTTKIEDTHYSVDYATGIITFISPNRPTTGQTVNVACEFDVPVRFDTDKLEVNMQLFDAGSFPQINLIELKQ